MKAELKTLSELCGSDSAAARYLGVTYTSYYRWLTDKANPSASHQRLVELAIQALTTKNPSPPPNADSAAT